MFNRKAKRYTEAQSDFVMRAKSAGCVCCDQLDPPEERYAQFNHHLQAGRRMGNDVGSAECEWHHMGIVDPRTTWRAMTEWLGPSRARGSKPFHAYFGSDEYLRDRTTAKVEKYRD